MLPPIETNPYLSLIGKQSRYQRGNNKIKSNKNNVRQNKHIGIRQNKEKEKNPRKGTDIDTEITDLLTQKSHKNNKDTIERE